MPKVHALLIGIDRYQRPSLDLRGCVNNVTLAEQLLRDRIVPGDLAVAQLHDDQARARRSSRHSAGTSAVSATAAVASASSTSGCCAR